MAHVAYISRGLSSHLNGSYGLCHQVAKLGHRVTYLCHDAAIRDRVEAQGFEFLHLGQDEAIAVRARGGPMPAVWNVIALLRWLREKRKRRLESIRNEEVEKTLTQMKADLVIADMECHFAIMAAVQAGYPVILASILLNLYRQPDVPPLSSTLIPDGTREGLNKISRAWRAVQIETIKRRLTRWFTRSGLIELIRPVRYSTISYSDLRAVARAKGFSVSEQTSWRHFLPPFMYTKLPLVYLFPWELELPHRARPNVTYIGSTVSEERAETQASDETLALWRKFQRDRQRASVPRPLVYCSMGSFVTANIGFLKRVVTVFEERPDWDLIVGLGGKASADDFGKLPENVTLLGWAPQMQILKLADAMITHCGPSAILECVHYGVPMVAYSTQYFDQNGNAARVAFHGLGVAGDIASDSPARIAELIQLALTDDAIRSRVEDLRTRTRAGVDVDVLGELLDRHLKRTESQAG